MASVWSSYSTQKTNVVVARMMGILYDAKENDGEKSIFVCSTRWVDRRRCHTSLHSNSIGPLHRNCDQIAISFPITCSHSKLKYYMRLSHFPVPGRNQPICDRYAWVSSTVPGLIVYFSRVVCEHCATRFEQQLMSCGNHSILPPWVGAKDSRIRSSKSRAWKSSWLMPWVSPKPCSVEICWWSSYRQQGQWRKRPQQGRRRLPMRRRR